ncbi:MAG: alpha/beta fold hydrolase [Blautia sp.]|nr:alpha/beta fold hydrolase [Blautia sp.]
MRKRFPLRVLLALFLLYLAFLLFRSAGRGGISSPSMSCLGEHLSLSVRGKSLLYEKAGSGPPVVLLHGNGGSHKDLSLLNRSLTEAGYQVYAFDSPGQGENAPLPAYHYEDMAEDIYAAIEALGLDRPALYGWSDGGILGLLIEIRHPGTLSLLSVSGVNVRPDGLKTEYLLAFSAMEKLGSSSLTEMIVKEPDITKEELPSLSLPVLLTAGSDDMIREDHTREIAEAIPGSTLIILPGETHGSYIVGNDTMANLLLDFFQKNGYV